MPRSPAMSIAVDTASVSLTCHIVLSDVMSSSLNMLENFFSYSMCLCLYQNITVDITAPAETADAGQQEETEETEEFELSSEEETDEVSDIDVTFE